MVTDVSPPPSRVRQWTAQSTASSAASGTAVRRDGVRLAGLLLLLTLLAVGIDGYHPFDEDAAIYVAGIKKAINPALYPSSAVFFSPYFQHSLFTNWNAWLVRSSHLPVADVLVAMHILTTWALLFACWRLAERCFIHDNERCASVLAVAAFLSIPVAGSALFMMDPYLTGRSFATPLSLLAICECLDRKLPRTVGLLVLVGLFHPLMAVYAVGFSLSLWALDRKSRTAIAVTVVTLVAAAFGIAAAVQHSQRAVGETASYQAAVATRSYFFLYHWHWYELAGLAAPMVIMLVYSWSQLTRATRQGVLLGRTCVVAGLTSIAVSLVFARPSSHSHLIAALQTIRPFLFIYFFMFLVLGGLLGRYWLKRAPWRWICFFAAASAGLAFVQHLTFPDSAHLELPWSVSNNGWSQAFVWVRTNTPVDAIFALDADYIYEPGEDAQGFRAIAERDSLADLSKDGGAAAAFPQLADRWMREQTATTGLNRIDDTERLRRLTPFHVSWVILDRSTRTALVCPFENDLVKVCRLL